MVVNILQTPQVGSVSGRNPLKYSMDKVVAENAEIVMISSNPYIGHSNIIYMLPDNAAAALPPWLDKEYTLFDVLRKLFQCIQNNQRTLRPWLHIAVNPDPDDGMSLSDVINFIEDYLERMGYGNQPYVVFRHSDIARDHYHITSSCVDEQGKKILVYRKGTPYKLSKRLSLEVLKELQPKYGYTIGKGNVQIIVPDHFEKNAGNIQKQLMAIINDELDNSLCMNFSDLRKSLLKRCVDVKQVASSRTGQLRIVAKGIDQDGKCTSHPYSMSVKESSAIFERIEMTAKRECLKKIETILMEEPTLVAVIGRLSPDIVNPLNTVLPELRLLNGVFAKKEFGIWRQMVLNKISNMKAYGAGTSAKAPEDYPSLKLTRICEIINKCKCSFFNYPVKPISIRVEFDPGRESQWTSPGRISFVVENKYGESHTYNVNEEGIILMNRVGDSQWYLNINTGLQNLRRLKNKVVEKKNKRRWQ